MTTTSAIVGQLAMPSARPSVLPQIFGSLGTGTAMARAVEAAGPYPRWGSDAFGLTLSLTPRPTSGRDASPCVSLAGLLFARSLFEQGCGFDPTLSATEAKRVFLCRLKELTAIQRRFGVSAWGRAKRDWLGQSAHEVIGGVHRRRTCSERSPSNGVTLQSVRPRLAPLAKWPFFFSRFFVVT